MEGALFSRKSGGGEVTRVLEVELDLEERAQALDVGGQPDGGARRVRARKPLTIPDRDSRQGWAGPNRS